jgi:hypothetical protein
MRDPDISDCFERSLWRFIQIFPSTYKGEPSTITCSLMLLHSFLLDENKPNSLSENDCLEVFYYINDDRRRPYLPDEFRIQRLQNPNGNLTYAAQTALAGEIRINRINQGFLGWLVSKLSFSSPPDFSVAGQSVNSTTNFWKSARSKITAFFDLIFRRSSRNKRDQFQNKKTRLRKEVDMGKKSIACIPLIGRDNRMIGLISIDSSLNQFSGSWRVRRHLKRTLAVFTSNMEKALLHLNGSSRKLNSE